MPNAGDKLRAVDVNLLANALVLPNGASPSANGVWEDWGTAVVVPNPGIPVIVIGWGSGQASDNTSSGNGCGMRLGISLDGGLSFDDGLGPFDQVGNVDHSRRGSLFCQHYIASSGAPSGDIHIRAQYQRTATGAAFFSGTVTALVIPNA